MYAYAWAILKKYYAFKNAFSRQAGYIKFYKYAEVLVVKGLGDFYDAKVTIYLETG